MPAGGVPWNMSDVVVVVVVVVVIIVGVEVMRTQLRGRKQAFHDGGVWLVGWLVGVLSGIK